MKNKLTEVYNNASAFFWYPPHDLLTERYVKQKETKLQENNFPGIGLSYIQESTPAIQSESFRRSKIFNNKFSTQNSMKANWKSLRSDNF
jgi:hypothetical protein